MDMNSSQCQINPNQTYYKFEQHHDDYSSNISLKYSIGRYNYNKIKKSIPNKKPIKGIFNSNSLNMNRQKNIRRDQAQSLRQRAKSNDEFGVLSKKAVKCIAIASGKVALEKQLSQLI